MTEGIFNVFVLLWIYKKIYWSEWEIIGKLAKDATVFLSCWM